MCSFSYLLCTLTVSHLCVTRAGAGHGAYAWLHEPGKTQARKTQRLSSDSWALLPPHVTSPSPWCLISSRDTQARISERTQVLFSTNLCALCCQSRMQFPPRGNEQETSREPPPRGLARSPSPGPTEAPREAPRAIPHEEFSLAKRKPHEAKPQEQLL